MTFVRSVVLCVGTYLTTYTWNTAGGWVIFKVLIISTFVVYLFYLLGELRERELGFIRSLFSAKECSSKDPEGTG